MLTQSLHSSSSFLPQYDPQNFEKKVHKNSLADTVKKVVAVTGIALGGASFITGFVLVGVATGGLAIPIAAPFILGSMGAAGVTSGCFGLGCLKVNRAAQKVLSAANLIQKETLNLEQTYNNQDVITTALTEKLDKLNAQTSSLAQKLGQGDQSLKEANQKIEQTKKQKKAFEKDLNKIQKLTVSLNDALERLQTAPASQKEIKALEKLIGKMNEKLDKLNENLLRMELKVKERNKSLQQVIGSLSSLQKTQFLRDLHSSAELEKTVKAIQLQDRK
ncbi:MAG: hypothetical protein ACRDAI_00945 [Candidatus Rhabdochlamydia sp.]